MDGSACGDDWLATCVDEICVRPEGQDVWYVFDNPAAGAALDDALRSGRRIGARDEALAP